MIGQPFALFSGIIQIQHRGHRIHPQAVGMVGIHPVQSVGNEERTHLVATIIKNGALPVGVKTLARIGMIVQVRAVEIGQTMRIRREMRGHPVQNHAHAGLMQGIHQVHVVLRRAETAARRKIPGDLIAPGREIGVLHDRQKLDVRKAHFAHIRRQFFGQLPVCQRFKASAFFHPGAEVYLIHGKRLLQTRIFPAPLHPDIVFPFVGIVPYHGGGIGRNFKKSPVRVSFFQPAAFVRYDAVFV